MKIKLVILLFIPFVLSCTNVVSDFSPKEIIVAGKVINSEEDSPKVIRIDFTDVFSVSPSRVQILDAHSSFRITYCSPYPAQFQLEYSKYVPLYAEPGDSIFVTINAKKIKGENYTDAVVFSGDKANINNSLWKGIEYIGHSLSPLYYDQQLSDTLSVTEYSQVLEQKLTAFHDSISNFTQNNNFPYEVEIILKGIINYEISTYWLQNYKSSDYTAEASVLKQELLENKKLKMFNPTSFTYKGWYNHAFNYANALYHGYVAEDYNNDEWMKGWEKVRSALKKMPAGINRDYITTMIIKDYFDEPIDSLPQAWDLINSSFVKDYIARLQSQTKPEFDDIDIPGISYLNSNNTVEPVPTNFIETISAKYRGKVIYIDVWGTWCGACKVLFPAAKLRKEEMRDKDVVFVYLCVTSKMEQWLKDIEMLQLEGEHYFLDEDASKLFTVNYQIASYPRYMIIGKDGKLKTNNAPRPSWKAEFEKEIGSYL
ncbi:TlpA family protein disulfide reductase [Bacteroides sp. OttesenSCG-928-F21]|nr:TlpA family protein disulfide reductase [Bacteroides sp. OttesenSCG-928-F21]